MIKKGFVLLYAVLLVSIVLTISLSLFDISYRQIVLSSTIESVHLAFYATDAVRGCIKYYNSNSAPKKYLNTETNIWRFFGEVDVVSGTIKYTPDAALKYPSNTGTQYPLDCGGDGLLGDIYLSNAYYLGNSSMAESKLDFEFDLDDNASLETEVAVTVHKEIIGISSPYTADQYFEVVGTYGVGTPRQVQAGIKSVIQ